MRPLIIILKKYLSILDLNEPFKGGLSSYGLSIMVLAYLKNIKITIPVEF